MSLKTSRLEALSQMQAYGQTPLTKCRRWPVAGTSDYFHVTFIIIGNLLGDRTGVNLMAGLGSVQSNICE